MLTGIGVSDLRSHDQVEAVALADGRHVDADLVVVGLGAMPNVGWLQGSELAVDRGLIVDEHCRASAPDVFGAGDVTRWSSRRIGRSLRVEHWTNALEQGRAAGRNVVSTNGLEAHDPVPYFWSDQHGKLLQFAGALNGREAFSVLEGAFDAEQWTVVWHSRTTGALVAAFSL